MIHFIQEKNTTENNKILKKITSEELKPNFNQSEKNLLIPDLVSFQYKSFKRFLEKSFIEVFQEINPLVWEFNDQRFEIKFFPECIQFRKPENDPQMSLYLGKTYGCSVYIPILISSTQFKNPKMIT